MERRGIFIVVYFFNTQSDGFKIDILDRVKQREAIDFNFFLEVILDEFDLHNQLKNVKLFYLSENLKYNRLDSLYKISLEDFLQIPSFQIIIKYSHDFVNIDQ